MSGTEIRRYFASQTAEVAKETLKVEALQVRFWVSVLVARQRAVIIFHVRVGHVVSFNHASDYAHAPTKVCCVARLSVDVVWRPVALFGVSCILQW